MGRQFRLEVGQQEFFPDLLFYNAHLHAYVVIELKAQSFHPSFLGQLSFYVSAINHQFKTDIDNPTIGLLICKDKDNVVAKYALESYKEPMGISEYQLPKLFPKDFKSSMPTIEELEKGLKDNQKQRNCFCMNKEEIKQEPNDGLIARILGGCFNCLDCHRLKYRLLVGNFLQYKSHSQMSQMTRGDIRLLLPFRSFQQKALRYRHQDMTG